METGYHQFDYTGGIRSFISNILKIHLIKQNAHMQH